jgi:hypothetical protein
VLGALTGIIYLIGLLRDRSAAPPAPAKYVAPAAPPEAPVATAVAGPTLDAQAGGPDEEAVVATAVAIHVRQGPEGNDDTAAMVAVALHLEGCVDDEAVVAAAVALHLSEPGSSPVEPSRSAADAAGENVWGAVAHGRRPDCPVPGLRRA